MSWISLCRPIVTVCAATCILAAYGLASADVVNPDAFVYAEVAQRCLHGDRLYVDAWQDKPPIAILFYVVPQLFAPGSTVALHVWLGVWVLLQGIVAIIASGVRLTTVWQRYVVALVLALLPLSSAFFAWPSTQNIANLFIVWLLFVSYRLVTKGTAPLTALAFVGIGLAFLFNIRQNTVVYGIVPLAAILLAHTEHKSTTARLAAVVAGLAVGFVAVLGMVLSTSDLSEYVDTVFDYPKRYAAAEGKLTAIKNVIQLTSVLPRQPLAIITALLAAPCLFAKYPNSWKVKLFLSCVLLVGLAQCVLPLKPYVYYWANFIPVTALLAFHCLAEGTPGSQREGVISCATVCGLLVLMSIDTSWHASRSTTAARLNQVAAAVDHVTTPEDSLYVVSSINEAGYLCFATKARPAHRFFFGMQLDGYWSTILPQPIDEVLRDYQNFPPTIIVARVDLLEGKAPDGRDGDWKNQLDLLQKLLEQSEYTVVDTVSDHRIFKRKGL